MNRLVAFLGHRGSATEFAVACGFVSPHSGKGQPLLPSETVTRAYPDRHALSQPQASTSNLITCGHVSLFLGISHQPTNLNQPRVPLQEQANDRLAIPA